MRPEQTRLFLCVFQRNSVPFGGILLYIPREHYNMILDLLAELSLDFADQIIHKLHENRRPNVFTIYSALLMICSHAQSFGELGLKISPPLTPFFPPATFDFPSFRTKEGNEVYTSASGEQKGIFQTKKYGYAFFGGGDKPDSLLGFKIGVWVRVGGWGPYPIPNHWSNLNLSVSVLVPRGQVDGRSNRVCLVSNYSLTLTHRYEIQSFVQ